MTIAYRYLLKVHVDDALLVLVAVERDGTTRTRTVTANDKAEALIVVRGLIDEWTAAYDRGAET